MKKLLKVLFISILCISFIGCTNSNTKGNELKEGLTAMDVVKNVEEQAPMQMPMELDEEMAKDLAYLNSADMAVVVKAKDGKIDTVKTSLQKMIDTERENAYLPDQKEKLEKAIFKEKGNYVILLVNKDVKAAEAAVDECFE